MRSKMHYTVSVSCLHFKGGVEYLNEGVVIARERARAASALGAIGTIRIEVAEHTRDWIKGS